MAFPQIYCVEWLSGFEVKDRCGLAWLIARPEAEGIDGKLEYEKLDDDPRRNLANRFNYWLNNPIGVTKKEYCHGWTEEGYENVYVFKYREHRIFGFLCHPDQDDQRFIMCVLCSYTIKEGWEADKSLKDLMQKFSKDSTKLAAAQAVHESNDCPYTR